MKYNPDIQKRRSIRLRGYDYSSPGVYFITICTFQKECFLGKIKIGQIELNDFGEIVEREWEKSFQIRKEIRYDSYVIMPNHLHGIIIIVGARGSTPNNIDLQNKKADIPNNTGLVNIKNRVNCHLPLQMKPKSLSSFVAGFKSNVSRKIGFSIWQRNYYEHIIRDEKELNKYRQYIKNNPSKWDEDEENPNKIGIYNENK